MAEDTIFDDDVSIAPEPEPLTSPDEGVTAQEPLVETTDTSAVSVADVPQTQGSDAAPQVDYEAEYVRNQYIGAAALAGIDPRQYSPEQLPYAIRDAWQRQQQQIAWAQQVYADPGYQEYLRHRGQAGASPQAQGSAPAVSEEPFDYRKALQDAFTPPTPPPYAKALVDQGLIAQSPTGKFIATDKGRTVVTPDELAAVNKFFDDVTAHEAKRVEAIEKALDARLTERLTEREQKQRTEAHIVQTAAQLQSYCFDQFNNPTPFGQAFFASLYQLKDSGLSPQVRTQVAQQMAVGRVAPSLIQQAQAYYQQQQYGQQQPTQTFNAPQQVHQPPAQQVQPQPQISFVDRAAQSPAGAGGGGGKPRRVYRHESDLLGVFDEAIARLQGS